MFKTSDFDFSKLKVKNLSLNRILVVVALTVIVLSVLAFMNLGKVETKATTVNYADGQVSLEKKYFRDGVELDSIVATGGETITVRLRYNNTSSQNLINSVITDSIPEGFTYVPGSLRNTYVDLPSVVLPDSLFTGSSLTVSPTSGYQISEGDSPQAGTLPIGRFRNARVVGCSLNFNNEWNQNMFALIDVSNNSTLLNTPCTTVFGADSSPLVNFNNTNLPETILIPLNGGRYFVSAGCSLRYLNSWNENMYQPQRTTSNPNGITGNCPGIFDSQNTVGAGFNSFAPEAYQIDLLNQRFLTTYMCVLTVTDEEGNFMWNQNLYATLPNQPAGTDCYDIFDSRNSTRASFNNTVPTVFQIDTFDSSRSFGYIEYQMVAPSPTVTTLYGTNATLTADGLVTITEVALETITIIVPAQQVTQPQTQPVSTRRSLVRTGGSDK